MRLRLRDGRCLLALMAMVVGLAVIASVPVGAVADAPWDDYGFYFGNLHSHTSYSDGVLTPSDAFQVARDAARLDFLAVTDHGYYMQEATNLHLWYKAHEEADAMYEPGRFVTLIGFEWTFTDGHMNGLDTAVAASRDTQRDMQAFIDFLVLHDGIGVFNHPSYDIQPNWNDFEYRGDADRQVALIEVGSGSYTHNITNERAYQRALERGWFVGAASNQDNHRANWGTVAPTRTVAVARALTREDILDALRSMRTYATEDGNVRLFFACEGQAMGSALDIVRGVDGSAAPMEFTIFVDDPDSQDRLASVEIVSNGSVVWADKPLDAGRYVTSAKLAPSSSYSWFYVRARQADGDLVVSSPIWITSGTGINACNIVPASIVPQVGRELRVKAEIVNRNASPVHDCVVTLFTSGEWGKEAVGSVEIDLPAGRSSDVEFVFTPSHVGRCALELHVASRAEAPDVFPGAGMTVRAAGIPRVMIDEGHNNRYSGYMNRLVALLADAGYDPALSSGAIDSALLDRADVLVVNMPEQGFALTPTDFADDEVRAMADFVLGGGSLLLAGWSAVDDGSRDPGDLNNVLSLLGAAVSYDADDAGSPDLSDIVDVPWGADSLRAEEVRPLRISGSSARVVAELGGTGDADLAVFATIEKVGEGRVAVLGAPVFSDYDLFRDGYSNARFTLNLFNWLCGGEWSAR